MKKLILSLAVIAAAVSVNAQAKTSSSSAFKASVGLELAVPVGDFKTGHSFGIGGTVQGDYWVDPAFAITGQAGYISFIGKDYTVAGFTIKPGAQGIIPLLAGIKYKFSPMVYASAQLGTGIFTAPKGGSGSTSTFAYAPGIGFQVSPNFDILVKYQAYSKSGTTLGSFGTRLAYTF